MSSRHGASAWRADAMAFRLVSKELPDAVVVFDPLSGSTLMLSDLCWFVLSELMQADTSRGTTALLSTLCATAAASDEAEAVTQLDDALAGLLDAGLIHAETQ